MGGERALTPHPHPNLNPNPNPNPIPLTQGGTQATGAARVLRGAQRARDRGGARLTLALALTP